VACGSATPTPAGLTYPATGLVLLSSTDGAVRGSATVGNDPVAVIVSGDGRTAYVADSSPGDVYAVALPSLTVKWKQHTGGAPFGLLLLGGRLYVSLFDSAAIDALDPSSGRVLSAQPAPAQPAVMTTDPSGRLAVAASGDFGITVAAGDLWTADYKGQAIVDLTHARRVPLATSLFPFWVSSGSNRTLLIAAEGASEDSDPGAVLSYNPMDGSFTTLATPRDPDQVIESDATVLIAAHGDHEILALRGGMPSAWAHGASPVGLAVDTGLGLVVVAVNSHE
jgi:DNA-binding beta-propeller fold protein YncE